MTSEHCQLILDDVTIFRHFAVESTFLYSFHPGYASHISYIHTPCGLGDQNSANVCPCACRKRRLIKGYKLSYTTGNLYAWLSCMQWGVWVWTVGYRVVLVQVIYCSKGGWVLFLERTASMRGYCSKGGWVLFLERMASMRGYCSKGGWVLFLERTASMRGYCSKGGWVLF